MNKSRVASLGCVSLFVVICGVVMSILVFLLLEAGESTRRQSTSGDWAVFTKSNNLYWLVGLVYVIPGLLAILAAFVQKRGLYIFNCIISMISLVIMGIVFFFIGFAVVLLIFAMGAVSDMCTDFDGSCRCRSSENSIQYDRNTPFETCDVLSYIIGLTIGITVAMVFAWILLLTSFILSCYYACRPTASSTASGTILVPAQQPMIQHGDQGFYQPKA